MAGIIFLRHIFDWIALLNNSHPYSSTAQFILFQFWVENSHNFVACVTCSPRFDPYTHTLCPSHYDVLSSSLNTTCFIKLLHTYTDCFCSLCHLWNSVGESLPPTLPGHCLPPTTVPHNLLYAFTYCIYLLACLSPTRHGKLSENKLTFMCLWILHGLRFVEWTGDYFMGTWC